MTQDIRANDKSRDSGTAIVMVKYCMKFLCCSSLQGYREILGSLREKDSFGPAVSEATEN